jgi:hypothetical protein
MRDIVVTAANIDFCGEVERARDDAQCSRSTEGSMLGIEQPE